MEVLDSRTNILEGSEWVYSSHNNPCNTPIFHYSIITMWTFCLLLYVVLLLLWNNLTGYFQILKTWERKGKTLPKNWRHRNTGKINRNISTFTYLSQSEKSKCMWTHGKDGLTRVFERCHQGLQGRKVRGDGGEIKWKLSEVNIRAVSREQKE